MIRIEKRAVNVPSAPSATPMPMIFPKTWGWKFAVLIPATMHTLVAIVIVFLPNLSADERRHRQMMVFSTNATVIPKSLRCDLSQ